VIVTAVLMGMLTFAAGGCDQDIAAQAASLSGGYVGDLVTATVTRFLEVAWNVEAAEGDTHEDEHSHEAEALHEHEH
jgi:hypothetical protein